MARRPKPWYRESRGCWYVTIGGKLHNLGPDKKAAEDAFYSLMSGNRPVVTSDTVVSVLDQFLAWNDKNRAPRTQETYMRFLQPFATSIGRLSIGKLRAYHVQRFIDGLSAGPSVKNMAWRTISRAFNWAVNQELMDRNPAAGVSRPAALRREDFVTEAEYAIILQHTPDQEFRDVLVLAWDCGARPHEIFNVTAANVELDKYRWYFPRGKGGRPRYVYLTAAAEEITRRAMAEHPTGPLFRNRRGNPWERQAVQGRFRFLAPKVGRKVSLYLFRHAQITRQIASGMDSHIVAKLAGHSDSRMIDTVYSHVSQDWEFMRDKLRGSMGQDRDGDGQNQ